MGQAIPRQHPAVVLRSHYNHLRALLAGAMVAVVGLSGAVVILASDRDELAASTRGPLPAQLPNTGYEEGTRGPLPAQLPNTRYDGGPEEGTRGVVPARQPNVESAAETKDEAKTAASIGQSSGATELRGSKASDYGASQYQAKAGSRPDGGPEEGTRGPGH